MGHFCDGRASVVVGTHTHAPTADHQILPHGTAFISDVGMTGDYNSVIGMEKDEPLTRFLRKIASARFEPALGEATLCALAVETDDATGLARHIAAVRLGGRLEEARPSMWSVRRTWRLRALVVSGSCVTDRLSRRPSIGIVLQRAGTVLPCQPGRWTS